MWKITPADLGGKKTAGGYLERVGHKMPSRSAKQVYDAYHAMWYAVISNEKEEEDWKRYAHGNQSGSQFSAMHC